MIRDICKVFHRHFKITTTALTLSFWINVTLYPVPETHFGNSCLIRNINSEFLCGLPCCFADSSKFITLTAAICFHHTNAYLKASHKD